MKAKVWELMSSKNIASKPDKATYESHAQVLRGLINYHKRMMIMCNSKCCEIAKANNGECPKASVINDVYLEALEASLRLIEERVKSE